MKKNINKIVIVGGGSSGWMSASALIKSFPNMEITVVESPDVPIIGVGESTLGYINDFMKHLDLKDDEWMPACNATYKLSIKFTDFYKAGEHFYYPFGFLDYTFAEHGVMDWFNEAGNNPDIDPNDFAKTYTINYLMSEHNKMWNNNIEEKLRIFDWERNKAFHMDAVAFGEWLKTNYCLPRGVKLVKDHVLTANCKVDGDIESLQCREQTVYGDLFLDCTGFNAILINKILKEPFIDFHDTLMNNRAIAVQYQYTDKEKEMEPYTNCTAYKNGWVWNIPLWHRVGAGYVYSDKFVTPEEAEKEIKEYLDSDKMVVHNPNRSKDCTFRHIKIRHGRTKRSWVKNCVAVGLANGFIEPLESTGLLLTHEAVLRLIEVLESPREAVTQLDKDCYNHALANVTTQMKDFVASHYAMSIRDDTPYWKHVTTNINYDNNVLIDLEPGNNSIWSKLAERYKSRQYDHRDSGLLFIMAGMRWWPVSKTALRQDRIAGRDRSKSALAMEKYNRQKIVDQNIVDSLPTHYEFLKKYVYKNSNQ